jgi:hypothetical protein
MQAQTLVVSRDRHDIESLTQQEPSDFKRQFPGLWVGFKKR